jgi:hypothetical protein
MLLAVLLKIHEGLLSYILSLPVFLIFYALSFFLEMGAIISASASIDALPGQASLADSVKHKSWYFCTTL